MTDQLLATCWTSAGNVRPGITPDQSPHRIEDRIRAVAETGYASIGIEHADLVIARDTIGLPSLRRLIRDAGLVRTEIEFIDDWYTAGERRAASDKRRRDLLEMGAALEADHIKVGGGRKGDRVNADRLREEFAALARDAAAHGTKVALEPGAFSMLRQLDDAIDLVVDVADPNGGLLLDVWHLARSGYEYELLAERVPTWALLAVEIDDGSAEHGEDLLADTFDNRVLAGAGDFRVPEFVSAVRDIGYQGPWGVENMSVEHRGQDIRTALTRARDAARSVLQKAPADASPSPKPPKRR